LKVMKRLPVLAAAVALIALNTGSGRAADAPQDSAAIIQQIKNDADPATVLQQIKNAVFSTGPNGETAASADSVQLTPEEISKIAAMHVTAAISLQYTSTEWAQAQIRGVTNQLKKMGVQVVAVTDAGFKAETQVSDIETILTRKPKFIVSIPVDPSATADAFRRAAAGGVKLVFMDNVPKGFVPGKDYISDVSADNYGNGVVSGLLMAKALHGKGEIGLIYHGSDFFVTRQRYEGFKAIIGKYPGIKIVAEQGIAGPDFTGDAEKAASAILTSHPKVNGLWAVWDVPAEGVLSAARAAGRDPSGLAVTTCDLGANIAIDMAQDGYVKGTGSQWPIRQAETEAILAGYGLIGKEAPAYVALPAVPVTKENILAAWKQVHGIEAPDLVKKALQ
jgi:ribose transport system substrate-binding protein